MKNSIIGWKRKGDGWRKSGRRSKKLKRRIRLKRLRSNSSTLLRGYWKKNSRRDKISSFSNSMILR